MFGFYVVMVCRWGLVLLLLIVIGVVNLYDRAASVCERVCFAIGVCSCNNNGGCMGMSQLW